MPHPPTAAPAAYKPSTRPRAISNKKTARPSPALAAGPPCLCYILYTSSIVVRQGIKEQEPIPRSRHADNDRTQPSLPPPGAIGQEHRDYPPTPPYRRFCLRRFRALTPPRAGILPSSDSSCQTSFPICPSIPSYYLQDSLNKRQLTLRQSHPSITCPLYGHILPFRNVWLGYFDLG